MQPQNLIQFMRDNNLEEKCPKLMGIIVDADEISFGADMKPQEDGLMPLMHINITPSLFYREPLGEVGFLEMTSIMQAAVDLARDEIKKGF